MVKARGGWVTLGFALCACAAFAAAARGSARFQTQVPDEELSRLSENERFRGYDEIRPKRTEEGGRRRSDVPRAREDVEPRGRNAERNTRIRGRSNTDEVQPQTRERSRGRSLELTEAPKARGPESFPSRNSNRDVQRVRNPDISRSNERESPRGRSDINRQSIPSRTVDRTKEIPSRDSGRVRDSPRRNEQTYESVPRSRGNPQREPSRGVERSRPEPPVEPSLRGAERELTRKPVAPIESPVPSDISRERNEVPRSRNLESSFARIGDTPSRKVEDVRSRGQQNTIRGRTEESARGRPRTDENFRGRSPVEGNNRGRVSRVEAGPRGRTDEIVRQKLNQVDESPRGRTSHVLEGNRGRNIQREDRGKTRDDLRGSRGRGQTKTLEDLPQEITPTVQSSTIATSEPSSPVVPVIPPEEALPDVIEGNPLGNPEELPAFPVQEVQNLESSSTTTITFAETPSTRENIVETTTKARNRGNLRSRPSNGAIVDPQESLARFRSRSKIQDTTQGNRGRNAGSRLGERKTINEEVVRRRTHLNEQIPTEEPILDLITESSISKPLLTTEVTKRDNPRDKLARHRFQAKSSAPPSVTEDPQGRYNPNRNFRKSLQELRTKGDEKRNNLPQIRNTLREGEGISEKPVTESNFRAPTRGTVKSAKSDFQGLTDKKSHSEEVQEDDNYPEVYKQLKKAGRGPKEILALLKARKAIRDGQTSSKKAVQSIPTTSRQKETVPSEEPTFTSTEATLQQSLKTRSYTSQIDKTERLESPRVQSLLKDEARSERAYVFILEDKEPPKERVKFVPKGRPKSRDSTPRSYDPRQTSTLKNYEPQEVQTQRNYERRTNLRSYSRNDAQTPRSYEPRKATTRNYEKRKATPKSYDTRKGNSYRNEGVLEPIHQDTTLSYEPEPFRTVLSDETNDRGPSPFTTVPTPRRYDPPVKPSGRPRSQLFQRENRFRPLSQKSSSPATNEVTERYKADIRERTFNSGNRPKYTSRSRPTFSLPKQLFKPTTPQIPVNRFRARKASLARLIGDPDDLNVDGSESNSLAKIQEGDENTVFSDTTGYDIDSLASETEQTSILVGANSDKVNGKKGSRKESHIQRVPPKKQSGLTTMAIGTTPGVTTQSTTEVITTIIEFESTLSPEPTKLYKEEVAIEVPGVSSASLGDENKIKKEIATPLTPTTSTPTSTASTTAATTATTASTTTTATTASTTTTTTTPAPTTTASTTTASTTTASTTASTTHPTTTTVATTITTTRTTPRSTTKILPKSPAATTTKKSTTTTQTTTTTTKKPKSVRTTVKPTTTKRPKTTTPKKPPSSTTTTTTTSTTKKPTTVLTTSTFASTPTSQNLPPTPETKMSGDYVVYGLLPNNNLVRKVVRTTEAPVELPFIVYGLYPNGTIVRRYPNGTVIPDTPEIPEENEVLASIEPGNRAALEEIVEKDSPLSYLYPNALSSMAGVVRNSMENPTATTTKETVIQKINPTTRKTTPLPTTESTTKQATTTIKHTTKATTQKPKTTKPTTSKPKPKTAKPTTTTPKATTVLNTPSPKSKTSKATTAKPTTVATTKLTTLKPTSVKTTKKPTTTPKPTTTKPTTTAKPKPKTPKPTTAIPISTTKPTSQQTPTTQTTPPKTTQKQKVAEVSSTTQTMTSPLIEMLTTTAKPSTTTQKTKKAKKPKNSTVKTTTTTKQTTPSTTTTAQSTSVEAPETTSPVTMTTQSTTTTKKPKTKSKSRNSSRSKSKKTTRKPTTTTDTASTAQQLAEDIALLNSILLPNGLGNRISPSGETTPSYENLADRVIQLAIERAQRASTTNTKLAELQALSTTATPVLIKENTISTTESGSSSTEGVSSTEGSKSGTGKISLWVIPTEESSTKAKLSDSEVNVLNALLASPSTPEGLSLQDQILLAELLNTPSPSPATNKTKSSRKRKKSRKSRKRTTTSTTTTTYRPFLSALFGGQRGGGLLRGSLLPEPDDNSSDSEGGVRNQGRLVDAAINVTRAVSQFMGLVITGAAQSFQNFLQTRTRALADALTFAPA